MMKRENFQIAQIYVPVKRRTTLVQARVAEIAESMLKDGQQTPILVRPDGARFVLVEGLHRLEAAKALGEKPSSASGWMPGSIRAARFLSLTCSTSDVAVCCSSASERSSVRWRSSLSSRVFSIPITA